MTVKPTYEELERRIQQLEKTESELRKKEDVLRESERELTNILNNMTDVVWSISWPDLTHNYFSPSLEKMYGRSEQEFMDNPTLFKEVTHIDDQHLTENAMKQLVEEGEAVRECRIIKPDGTIVWVNDRSKMIYDENHQPIRVEGVTQDITKRKRAEEVLRLSNEQLTFYRYAVDSMEDYKISVVDDNYCYRIVSSQYMKEYNLSEADLVGKSVAEVMGQDVFEQSIKPNLDKALQGHAVYYPGWFEIPSKGLRYMEVSYYPLLVENWKSTSVVALIRDTTDRKQAEEELSRERERLASIIEGTNVGTWEWNVQTGETIFNERWAEIIGYSLEEISPVSIDTWMKFTHPDDLKNSGELLQRHFSGELDYYECEARMRHKNGEWVWVLDRGKVAVWTEDGKPLRIMGTHQDITERKQVEEERNQLVIDLQRALANVKQLTGLLPICSHCKKIRDDKGYWNQIEVYINQHSEATFSHGICQDCIKKYYPDMDLYDEGNT